MNQTHACQAVINAACLSIERQLNTANSGNVSLRIGDRVMITPTGMRFKDMEADDIAIIDLEGRILGGNKPPSSEWPFHCGIYRNRPEINALVHSHSREATAWSCMRKPIPAFHFSIAELGGTHIPCSDYAPPGSEALSQLAINTLGTLNGCLLGSHGVIAVGKDLTHALDNAELIEILAHQYIQTLALGGPVLLSDEEINVVVKHFNA